MSDLIKDSLIVLGRIASILPLLLLVTLFMGKRAIGQLPVFDFLIIISLGSVVGADIADPSVNHIPTAVAIIALGIFQRVVAKWKISSLKFNKLITFEPTVVIKDGKLLSENLKKIKFSIDDILQLLRQKDIFDISVVDIAIIEANGSISVYKNSSQSTATLEDLGISRIETSPALPVIVKGKLYPEVLANLDLDQYWLEHQLALLGVKNEQEVFFASINQQKELNISLKNDPTLTAPKFYH